MTCYSFLFDMVCLALYNPVFNILQNLEANMAGDRIAQLFMGCVSPEPDEPTRPRIDRSMIGNPANFRHTAHIGATDTSEAYSNSGLQNQMNSKGGGNTTINLSIPHIQNAAPINVPQITAN